MPSDSEPLDVEAIRRDFPILTRPLTTGRHRKGRPPAFLDSGSSAQKPACVIAREREVQEHYFANAYRGVYEFGARVDEELEATRSNVAEFIGAETTEGIVFTSGTTFSLNLVARAWGGKFLQSGDEVLITEMEHHANIVPWQIICQERGARLRWLPITDDGRLDLSQLDRLLTDRTKMVSVAGMSNVLGTINDISQLTERAHAAGALICVDAAQSVPHSTVDVADSNVDFLTFSGHKLYGPTGVGVLYGRRELLDEMNPFLGGGHMISQVYRDHSTWADPPAKFEAGTLPIVQAISLGSAIDYVTGLGLDRIRNHENSLLRYAHEQLLSIDELTIHGPDVEHKGAICSLTIEGIAAADLAALLDVYGVFVRHGHHCAMPLHERLGVPATVRASLAVYNNRDDIDRLVEGLRFAIDRLR